MRLAVLALIFVSDAGAEWLQNCRVMGCECITENREIWDSQLFPHSLTESTGFGWVSQEQFLSAKWGQVISRARGKGNLKEKLSPAPFVS